MNTNKSHKSPQHLVVSDTFSHVGERYTVIAPVSVAEAKAYTTRMRYAVPTDKGVLNIPVSVPLKMV